MKFHFLQPETIGSHLVSYAVSFFSAEWGHSSSLQFWVYYMSADYSITMPWTSVQQM